MASESDWQEYLDALSEHDKASSRPHEWPQVRKAARERAERAVVNQFEKRSGTK